MRWVSRLIVRFRMNAKQRRDEATLSRMSTLELQDVGYPHRLKSSLRGIPEVPLINFDALSRHAKMRHWVRPAEASPAMRSASLAVLGTEATPCHAKSTYAAQEVQNV